MPERHSIDTEPHPVFHSYSAANFAEVAPERLSPVSWSLVGDPVERACRSLVNRLWPTATWHLGSHYTFVGYFACQPYHNLSAYCQLTAHLPGMTGEDVTESYFHGAETPAQKPGLRPSPLRRMLSLPRLAIEFGQLEERGTELDGRLTILEQRARHAAATPETQREALGEARTLLDLAWDLHYATTLGLVPLRVAQGRLGKRTFDCWDELEALLNRPPELIWETLHSSAEAEGELGPGDFLRFPFYEVADGHEPWSRYSQGGPQGPGAGRREPSDEIGMSAAAQGMLDHAHQPLLGRLTNVIRATLGARERSKSLAMRCMHVCRQLLPAIAATRGLVAEWPFLTVEELVDLHPARPPAELALRRRTECEEALLSISLPDQLDTASGREWLVPPPKPVEAPQPRGVSGGYATGVVVGAGEPAGHNGAPEILVCEAVDANIEPMFPRIAGIVTARGSALSHVSIIAREYGIPAVVGHPLALELQPGQRIAIDGTKGEVRIVE